MEQHNFTEQEKKVEEDDDVEWLKLGLGLGISNTTDTSSSACNKNIISHGSSSNPVLYSSSLPSSSSSSQGLIITHHHQKVGLRLGLGLLERGSQLGIVGSMVEPSSASYHHHHHHRNSLLGLSSSSLSGHCNYYHHHSSNNNDDGGGDINGMNRLRPPSSSSCRIDSQGLPISVPYIDQSHHYPPHHHNGVWFTLHSSTNRSGEALPQIPKAYIRVRDENMTVLMVKRYLVMKLGLSNETEIDISCMGESLSHIQTLKQVREGVWLPRLIESLNSTTLSSLGDSHDMSLHHIMSLLYRKHCFSNH